MPADDQILPLNFIGKFTKANAPTAITSIGVHLPSL